MNLSEQTIREVLGSVLYPGYNRDIVRLGLLRDVDLDGGVITVGLDPGKAEPSVLERLRGDVIAALSAIPGVTHVSVNMKSSSQGDPALHVVTSPARPSPAAAGSASQDLIPGVRRTIAIASGKGGVGKSTVATNLAVALAAQGLKVGLLDADIYGPSIPIMMGLRDEDPRVDAQQRLLPFERFGVRFMSLGFLVKSDSAVIWRGPMVMKAIEQLLRDVTWGELDLLVVDMPPGTGDAQLTLSQRIQLSGALIVTTPQDVALADAVRGVAMFRKVQVDVLGLVENMSYFECPKCSERSEVFGHGGGRREAQRLGVEFLGEIPLDAAIRDAGDRGTPIAAATPDGPQGLAFASIAEGVIQALNLSPGADSPEQGRTVFDRFRSVWRERS